jgi:hypothetical protein
MRALEGSADHGGLAAFFAEHTVEDGEYYTARARYLMRSRRPREGLSAAEKALKSLCEFALTERVRRDAQYTKARCLTEIYEQDAGNEAREQALGAWFDVKYNYRSAQGDPRFAEANTRIRYLAGKETVGE